MPPGPSHPPAADDGRRPLADFGLDSADERWLDLVRQADAPVAFGAIGRYELIAEVSRGGQGVVYRAVRPETGEVIAIKRLAGGRLASRAMRRRFEREIEALSILHHPHIVAILGSELIDGVPVLAMEWIDGQPISDWARATGLRRQLELFIQVCDAVQFAHAHGVIHRDLKPSNILVVDAGSEGSRGQGAEGRNATTTASPSLQPSRSSSPLTPRTPGPLAPSSPQPKVLDFGLARLDPLPPGDATSALATHEFVGTLRYSAPEQLSALRSAADVRTDVYALGVILFELLAGRPPYDLGDSFASAAQAIQHAEPRRPSAWRRGLSPELDAIVLKALQKEKAQRYQSVDALAADLRSHLAGGPIAAQPPSSLASLLRLMRRHRLVASLAAVVLLLTLVFAVVAATLAAQLAAQRDQAVVAQQREAEARAAAEEAQRQSDATSDFLAQVLAAADPMNSHRSQMTVRDALDAAAAGLQAAGLDPSAEAAVRHRLGVTYHSIGRYAPAAEQFERELVLRRSLSDGDDAHTAAALNELGHLRTSQGDYAEAETLLREALRLRRATLGAGHADVAVTLNNLAKVLHLGGRFDEAELLWRESLALRRAQPQPDGALIAASLHNLAATLSARGQAAQAETLQREALALSRAAQGGDHPDVAFGLHGLAAIVAAQGRAQEALDLYEEALRLKRVAIGNDHPATGFTLHQYGELRLRRGEFDAAAPLLSEALRVYDGALPPEHPRTQALLMLLVELYEARGDAAAADACRARQR